MSPFLAAALAWLIAATPPAVPPQDPPKPPPPADPIEKIDASVDRSLTGTVDKIDAKDENNGKLTLHTSGPADDPLYRYTFQIDEGKTKILTAAGDPLKDGLKSHLLTGAEVRVTFVDRRPGSAPPPPGVHFARTVQIVTPGK